MVADGSLELMDRIDCMVEEFSKVEISGDEEYLTIRQAAHLIGVSETTFRDVLMSVSGFPITRIPNIRRVLISKAKLLAFMSEHTKCLA